MVLPLMLCKYCESGNVSLMGVALGGGEWYHCRNCGDTFDVMPEDLDGKSTPQDEGAPRTTEELPQDKSGHETTGINEEEGKVGGSE